MSDSIPTPEAVEGMTDGELATERHYLSLGDGITWPARDVARFFATIDALKARALPLPHRYTGGPLEDGLYLWRRQWWPKMAWSSFGKADGFIRVGREPIPPASADEWVWLIGPIHIPPIPESEEASA